MAVAPEAEAAVRRMYDAFNRRDIQTALQAAHPDVDWPNVLEGRRTVGLADISDYVERLFRVIDARMDVLAISEDDRGDVVVRVHQVARFLSDGALIADEVVEHIYRFEDGMIVTVNARDARGNTVGPRERHPSDV